MSIIKYDVDIDSKPYLTVTAQLDGQHQLKIKASELDAVHLKPALAPNQSWVTTGISGVAYPVILFVCEAMSDHVVNGQIKERRIGGVIMKLVDFTLKPKLEFDFKVKTEAVNVSFKDPGVATHEDMLLLSASEITIT
ncbi:hypothetical protein LZ318_21140 [Saccharopolyspora indica]|uniref:hypothetical protein n=1 Tax=Saccharopolyspora indica TaxID=1229659 RepID=UPI0022EB64BA|nr:hypothetical protein [Saccharopolyspora indica]MDA3642454.1 hypothetical protein [Saccharopolyspora indica]